MKKSSSYDKLQKNIRSLKTPKLETWENKFQDKDYIIKIDIPEFTCLCPKTSLPDFATLAIEYSPDKRCVELKSLKYYVIFFRDVGIFNEHLVNKMLEDFVEASKPKWAKIAGEFNPRGGIKTTVFAEYKRKNQ